MSELTTRVLIAIPLAILLLGVTWIGGLPFELLFGIIALITIWEVHRIMRQTGTEDYFPISILIALIVWTGTHLHYAVSASLATLLIIITIVAMTRSKRVFRDRWLSTLFTGVYAPAGFLMLVYIRNMGTEMDGFWLTVTLFMMIWGNDIFAFFGGKAFGKKPLVPKISPKKTWGGFWWGFGGAATGFFIVYFLADPYPLPLWSIVAAVLIISIMGPLGDITASSLKRKANVKDSSSILPGHGGFFDRFDSMILSAPFLYFYLLLILRIY